MSATWNVLGKNLTQPIIYNLSLNPPQPAQPNPTSNPIKCNVNSTWFFFNELRLIRIELEPKRVALGRAGPNQGERFPIFCQLTVTSFKAKSCV